MTPKANVTYNLTPDNMVYATAAKGYRIGGGNASYAGNPVCSDRPARPLVLPMRRRPIQSDSVWNDEVGTKNKMWNGQAEISASAFRIN